VSGVSPPSGPITGGATVIISGSGFSGATAVLFGVVNAPSFTFVSDSQLTATTPPEATGTVDVTVTTASGTSPINRPGDQFIYVVPALPTVTAVSPTSGSTGGGNSVTISGTGFSGATQIFFGSVVVPATSFTVNSDSQITVPAVPAQTAQTVDVRIETAGGTSIIKRPADQYTYATPPPTVTAVTPTSGPSVGGTSVTISGSGFTGATSVQFGTVSLSAASFTVNSDSQITVSSSAAQVLATVPTGAPQKAVVDVTVTTPVGTSATGSADHYTYTQSVFVACSNSLVDCFTTSGAVNANFGTSGVLTTASYAGELAFDSSGNLYQTNNNLSTVTSYTPSGGGLNTNFGVGGVFTVTGGTNFNATLDPQGTPELWGVAFDGSGNLYVGDWGNSTVSSYLPNGNPNTSFGSNGILTLPTPTFPTSNAYPGYPVYMAFDASNNLYLTNAYSGVVMSFTSSGGVNTTFGGGQVTVSDPGTFPTAPQAIAFDASGNLYITDGVNNYVVSYTPSGSLNASFGSNGALALPVGTSFGGNPGNNPCGIAFDAFGNFYVADLIDWNVTCYTPSGSVNTSFGTNGIVNVSGNYPYALIVH